MTSARSPTPCTTKSTRGCASYTQTYNMTTNEHLDKIVAKCKKLLTTAERRTPGGWTHWPTHWAGGNNTTQYDSKNSCPWISSEQTPTFEVARINPKNIYINSEPMANASFIASCAGAAEAGWRATIAAIEYIQNNECPTNRFETQKGLEQIIAAWPEELLS